MTPRQRINGVKVALHNLSDEQLVLGVERTEVRLESVWQDLAKYNGEIALRPTLAPPEPEHYPNE